MPKKITTKIPEIPEVGPANTEVQNIPAEYTQTSNAPKGPKGEQGPSGITTPRKVRQGTRTLAELHEAPIKSMNDLEKIKYIEALRDTLVELEVKVTQLDEACKSAYTISRNAEDRYQTLRLVAIKQLNIAKQATATCNATMGLLNIVSALQEVTTPNGY